MNEIRLEFFRSLPADRFPALVALGEHVWLDNRDERFTAGLDALIDGLEQARRAPRRPTPRDTSGELSALADEFRRAPRSYLQAGRRLEG